MFDDEIKAAAVKYNVPAALVTAVVQHESNFEPLQEGDGGEALGLMQVHETAAQDVGKDWYELLDAIQTTDTPTAVALGLDIGVAYLAKMLKLFNSDARLALMAYNQGPTVITRASEYAAAVLAIEQEGKST